MPSDFYPPGTRAPNFEITAVYTKRKFVFRECLGTPVLLVFFTESTQKQIREASDAVREKYPDPAQLIIANIADLRFVPSLTRRMAEGIMNNAVKAEIKEIPKQYDPAEYILLLPDWSARVAKGYQVEDVDKNVALIMIDADGIIQGSYQGDHPAEGALELIAKP